MRHLLCCAALAWVVAVPALAEEVCAGLEKQTQAFSDAGQRGAGAEMAGALDADIIFYNETGERATRADLAGATPPPAGTPMRTIATTEWQCQLHGDVAVTSFVDVLQPGKADEARFRSVETWLKEPDGWKMIASETLTLQTDPEGLTLDARTLDAYAGTYVAAGGLTLTLSRKGDGLEASLNGGAATPQTVLARDIVFTPGRSATPKVFQRDDSGKITGFVYVRGKNSLSFKRVG